MFHYKSVEQIVVECFLCLQNPLALRNSWPALLECLFQFTPGDSTPLLFLQY